ncbi:MAG: polysaccharide deacetylase family protein [Puniceicoccaceae bacterium]|nr:MAG: polysaccharide deacetylase family protein [Puniceicoccaceae bacterium]
MAVVCRYGNSARSIRCWSLATLHIGYPGTPHARRRPKKGVRGTPATERCHFHSGALSENISCSTGGRQGLGGPPARVQRSRRAGTRLRNNRSTRTTTMWNPLRHTSAYIASRRRLLGTITHVRTDQKVVALTFDDGPDPEFTPKLLEILRTNQARATFFVVGKRAEEHPELLDQIIRDGHLLGNHSWSHTALPLLSRSARLREIRRCHRALPSQPKRILRPPYGYQSRATRLDAYLLGYDVVTWNAAGDDCFGAGPDAIRDRLMKEIKPGSIVLMHDSLYKAREVRYRDRGPALEALTQVFVESAGDYRFVTVAELMKLGKPQREMWWRKPKVDMLEQLV